MSTDFVVVDSHPLMLSYVDKLQRQNAEALAFYPTQVFEREMQRGRILMAILNGEPCGYIYHGAASDGVMRCHQVCIQYDARRRLYGAQLVAVLEERAVSASASWIRLRCGFDLDANDFWKSLGYTCTDVQNGGVRRSRKINVWQKVCGPALFGLVAVDPAKGKTSAAMWAKHKQTGLVSQFVRGNRMGQYRAILEAKSQENRNPDPAGDAA